MRRWPRLADRSPGSHAAGGRPIECGDAGDIAAGVAVVVLNSVVAAARPRDTSAWIGREAACGRRCASLPAPRVQSSGASRGAPMTEAPYHCALIDRGSTRHAVPLLRAPIVRRRRPMTAAAHGGGAAPHTVSRGRGTGRRQVRRRAPFDVTRSRTARRAQPPYRAAERWRLRAHAHNGTSASGTCF